MGAFLLRRLAASGVALGLLSSCATTSTMTVPRCAERVEIAGQHERRGQSFIFDHSLDTPWTATEIVLERDGETVERVWLPHTRPDPGRLFAGVLTTVIGGAVTTTALWQVQQGAPLDAEGPFYGLVLGGTAVLVGGALSLTGWSPAAPATLDECRDDD
jgi:hypothetical protein